MMIRCSGCKNILVRNNKLVNAVKVRWYDVAGDKISERIRGIMCTACGRFISEDKIREVLRNVQKA